MIGVSFFLDCVLVRVRVRVHAWCVCVFVVSLNKYTYTVIISNRQTYELSLCSIYLT